MRYEVNAVMTLLGLAQADFGVYVAANRLLSASSWTLRTGLARLVSAFSDDDTFAGSIQSPIASRGAG